jgi:isocitrate lyase
MHNPGKAFRDLLRTEPYLFTGGVYSPLDAQIAERVGIKSIYLSGYSMALANGWPDMGFLTQTEVARIGAMVASAVEIPVIADADDGYGNALSTIRTVQEYVRSGVAGIHIEDQVFPKRCGHIAGKTIISEEQAVGKYRAAIDTRNQLNPDFVIIARTDAFGAVGGSLEEAIRRGRAYADAGVDLVWPELSSPTASPRWPSPRRCARHTRTCRWPSTTPRPSSGTRTPTPSPSGAGGARLQVHLHHALRRPRRHVRRVERDGRAGADQEQAQWRLEKTKDGHPTESHHVMARVSHFQELEKRYIPGSDERIKGSAGYDEKTHALVEWGATTWPPIPPSRSGRPGGAVAPLDFTRRTRGPSTLAAVSTFAAIHYGIAERQRRSMGAQRGGLGGPFEAPHLNQGAM